MSSHFHFSRLTSLFNSRAPVGDFMNGWVWTAVPDAIFPHFGQICSREGRAGGSESSSGSWDCSSAGSQDSYPDYGYIKQQGSGAVSLYRIPLGFFAGLPSPYFKHGPLQHYTAWVRFRLKSWMRKGDSHLELLIYLAPILQQQSPGGKPCQSSNWPPLPMVLPRFWPWQRFPLCCLTRKWPGYYWMCDLSMCGSLIRSSTTLCLGHYQGTPVYPLIVCPSVGREEEGMRRREGGTWKGEHGSKDTRLGNWEQCECHGKKKQPAACELNSKAVIRLEYLSVGGAATPTAFDVTATTFAFVSLTSCQFSYSPPKSPHTIWL